MGPCISQQGDYYKSLEIYEAETNWTMDDLYSDAVSDLHHFPISKSYGH